VNSSIAYEYFVCVRVGQSSSGKTDIWHLLSKSSHALLGVVKWYAPWRQYCFFPESETLYSVGCLNDVRNFLGGLKDGDLK